jgi:hypothetical protein
VDDDEDFDDEPLFKKPVKNTLDFSEIFNVAIDTFYFIDGNSDSIHWSRSAGNEGLMVNSSLGTYKISSTEPIHQLLSVGDFLWFPKITGNIVRAEAPSKYFGSFLKVSGFQMQDG